MKTILIRADGSPQIGLGHLTRCMALANMLKDYFAIIFICKNISKQIEKEIQNHRFQLLKITNETGFFEKVTPQSIVVLDGYHFDITYQKKIKEKGSKLVCIDDMHDQEFVADLIINHSPGVSTKDYLAQPYTQFALGTQYALLRPSFLYQAKKERKITGIKTILICFGGSDPKNLTERALKIVKQFTEFKKIIVVTGDAYSYDKNLLEITISDSRIESHKAIGEKEMLDLMLDAELALVPASGILFEALAAKCLIISGMYTKNQENIYQHFKDVNSFFDAGDFSSEKLIEIFNKVFSSKELIKQTEFKIAEESIVKLFQQLSLSYEIHVRLASSDDIELTYQWSINKKRRAYSSEKHIMTYEEHADWFAQKSRSVDCLFLIIEYSGKPVGSFRFDGENNRFKISYLLDPSVHRQGLGIISLCTCIDYFTKSSKFKSGCILEGLVLNDNIASVKAFQRLGFSKEKYAGHYVFTKKCRTN
ncbi:MAG TPA: UDP-2,4-diacetamido-2,4,6-trideoxy-beta-L-altropyranose hydrolase [Bacteroidia bacterium]|jgi:UDP-2,4-diacetamido-2,4,6-trideoxy-beta-L-altropyranose hydrolase|nr:UDP-2,4-diacetamido-2,4,6-trideoxy-beta-L-altropyranose hydrolase [Bacteroidia bacterium]